MSSDPGPPLGTVLGVWAHPDDEAYLMAGTCMRAMDQGSHVACLTMTTGEAGESADEQRWPQHALHSIRANEIKASMAILGIEDHTLLGLPDGGLADVNAAEGVDLVASVIERVRPDTILTFGPDGMTGHPDHITVGEWAGRAALAVLGDRCRVLAATKTDDWLTRFADLNSGILTAPPPRTAAEDLALQLALSEVELDRKVRALRAQASQTSGLLEAFGEPAYRAWVADEYWVTREAGPE